jgi:predicted membrane channel-forming protein YqfA (hemolysin III family)
MGTERVPHKAWRLAHLQDAGVRENFASLVANLVTIFLFGVLILYLAPDRVRHMAQESSTGWKRVLRFFAVGVLVIIILGAVGLLSLLTVQTMPLPIILGMVFLLSALGGMVTLAYQLGKALLTRAEWSGRSPLLSLALGTLILFALTNVPYIGGVLLILILLTGAGLSITTRFGSGKPWNLLPLMEDVQV